MEILELPRMKQHLRQLIEATDNKELIAYMCEMLNEHANLTDRIGMASDVELRVRGSIAEDDASFKLRPREA